MSIRQRHSTNVSSSSIQEDYKQFAIDSANWYETVTRFVTREYTTLLEQITHYYILSDGIKESCDNVIKKCITETVTDLECKSSYPKWEELKTKLTSQLPLYVKEEIYKWNQHMEKQLQLLQIERNTVQDKVVEQCNTIDTLQQTMESKTNEYDKLLHNHILLQGEYKRVMCDIYHIKQMMIQTSNELEKQSSQLRSVVSLPQRTSYCCKTKCIVS